MIPVTAEAFAAHRKGGWDAFLLACSRVGARHLMGGPMLFLGGSTALKEAGAGCRVGDLSGLVMRRLPPGIRGRYSPGPEIGAIPDWELRIQEVAALVAGTGVRPVLGMSPRRGVLLRGGAQRRPLAGRATRPDARRGRDRAVL